ncbi:uncharacterized protein F4807DRAFT_443836 [Annulohypoxylon truncatum]|uniref:uncharacterized protein n=1 Tax=Annulohypoxylon truncatum TaxID=327061 RepID=UPI002008800A|nr:uncharacterized protein F4807DRAFT_443836 [Annulohypoxylon truncatum]KAI1205197.1 hypothetical protein F4807DRAFT_443836 [Annulohypoxylon truncatum]
MRAGVTVYLLTIAAMIMAFAAGGCCYFAAFVHNELRPYFDQHDMKSYLSQAHATLLYLTFSAALLWILYLGTILKVCVDNSEFGFPKLFLMTSGLIVITLLAMVTKDAWSWWEYFKAAEGLNHLAINCHWLAGVCIANMVTMLVAIVGIIIISILPDLEL